MKTRCVLDHRAHPSCAPHGPELSGSIVIHFVQQDRPRLGPRHNTGCGPSSICEIPGSHGHQNGNPRRSEKSNEWRVRSTTCHVPRGTSDHHRQISAFITRATNAVERPASPGSARPEADRRTVPCMSPVGAALRALLLQRTGGALHQDIGQIERFGQVIIGCRLFGLESRS